MDRATFDSKREWRGGTPCTSGPGIKETRSKARRSKFAYRPAKRRRRIALPPSKVHTTTKGLFLPTAVLVSLRTLVRSMRARAICSPSKCTHETDLATLLFGRNGKRSKFARLDESCAIRGGALEIYFLGRRKPNPRPIPIDVLESWKLCRVGHGGWPSRRRLAESYPRLTERHGRGPK